MDREKVIKGFELCLKTIEESDCRKECPYYEACQKYEGRVIFQPLMRDTLAMLKEQEAVKPIPPEDEFGLYRCGKCYHQLFRCVDKYCSRCGQAVKWEGR